MSIIMDRHAQRQSNIEFLRIVAMICIVIGHYVGKGGIVTSAISPYQMLSLIFFGGGDCLKTQII